MIAEGFGTFILVVFGCGSAVLMRDQIGILDISIVAAVYSIGAISGAHPNPAISLGMVTAGRMSGAEFTRHSLAQIADAIVAVPVFELIATFTFVTVILDATQKGSPAALAGLAIWLTLAGTHLAGFNVIGISVNSARSIGPALFAAGKALTDLWRFIAPQIGRALAGKVFKAGFTRPADKLSQVSTPKRAYFPLNRPFSYLKIY